MISNTCSELEEIGVVIDWTESLAKVTFQNKYLFGTNVYSSSLGMGRSQKAEKASDAKSQEYAVGDRSEYRPLF